MKDADPNDIFQGAASYSIRPGASGPGFIQARVFVINPYPNVAVSFDDFQVWIGNDPNGRNASNFSQPTGMLVHPPIGFDLFPEEVFDTFFLPEMPVDTYVLLTAIVSRLGIDALPVQWAYAFCDEPSQCIAEIPGELNGDCCVDIEDLAILIDNWDKCGKPVDRIALGIRD